MLKHVWLGPNIVYGWGLLLFKKQKLGMIGTLIYLKWQNKVPLGSYIIESAKLRYG